MTGLVTRDGTPFRVRPLVPGDRDRLVDQFERLSDESRYERFLAPIRELTPEWLRHLVDEVDGVRHVALVAETDEEPVGIGRFVRERAAPERAEIAVTIADAWHGKGVGSLLVAELAAAARWLGVTTFTATLHARNVASYRMLRHAGDVRRVGYPASGVVDVVIDLAQPPVAAGPLPGPTTGGP